MNVTITLTTTTASASGPLSDYARDFAIVIIPIAVSTLISLWLDKRSRSLTHDEEYREEHFGKMKNEVISPMIEACYNSLNFFRSVVRSPEMTAWSGLRQDSPLFEVLDDHFPEIKRDWDRLCAESQRLSNDCLTLAEKIMNELSVRSHLKIEKHGRLPGAHYLSIDHRMELYSFISSYRNRHDKIVFTTTPTAIAQFQNYCEIIAHWYWLGDDKSPEIIILAYGDDNEARSLEKALHEVDAENHSEVQKLHQRKDESIHLAEDLMRRLKNVGYQKSLSGKCKYCR